MQRLQLPQLTIRHPGARSSRTCNRAPGNGATSGASTKRGYRLRIAFCLPLTLIPVRDDRAIGFNRRRIESERNAKAEAEAAARRATDAQVVEDAERLIGAWNEREGRRMPLLFAPTIGAALASRHHFLWVYCPACHTMRDIDLRTLDRYRGAAVTSLIPVTIVPLMPAARAVRRTRVPFTDEHRR